MRIAETGEMPLLCNQKPMNDNLAAREWVRGSILNSPPPSEEGN